MSPRLVLFRRHIARLRANRSIAIGLALGVIILAMISVSLYGATSDTAKSASELAFAVQRRLWVWGNPFGTLVVVLAVVLGSSLVNDDVKAGTIFGVLARPVSRADYFMGSWSAAAVVLVAIDLMRCAMSLGVGLTLEGRVSAALPVALIAVLAGDLLRLATFAVLGIVFSTGVAVFTGLCLYFIEFYAFAPKAPTWVGYPLRAIAVFLPLSGVPESAIENILTGATRDAASLFEITAYRLCWTTVLVLAGIWAFQRREIAPRM